VKEEKEEEKKKDEEKKEIVAPALVEQPIVEKQVNAEIKTGEVKS